MAKRVMRSNRRTQRRRGSQLKQRKKRSKLLKRSLKRRNSFRKKNTYKRRKTNMKRGGRPESRPEVEPELDPSDSHGDPELDIGSETESRPDPQPDTRPESPPLKEQTPYINVHNFAYFYEQYLWRGSEHIFKELTTLLKLQGVSIFVERKTILGGKRKCRVIKIERSYLRDDFVRFENEGECKRKRGDFRRHGITLDNLIDNYLPFVEEDEGVGVKLCFYHKSEKLYSYAGEHIHAVIQRRLQSLRKKAEDEEETKQKEYNKIIR